MTQRCARLADDALKRAASVADSIMEVGQEMVADMGQDALCMPHARHIDGRIWEMRAKGRDGIARGLYVVVTDRRVIVVRFFIKKTQKTPLSEIRLALKRCGENEL